MEDALMSGFPEALTIWLALLGASLLGFGVLAALAGHGRRRSVRDEREESAPRPARGPQIVLTRLALAIAKEPPQPHTPPAPRPEPTEADDNRRFAEEVATAAARATVTADRRQADWECAQRTVAAAWQAYEVADQAARRAIRAAAFPAPATSLTPAEYASRERHLHRIARAAHARGELSTDQFIDAMAHRNGFDPRMHPFEQDARVKRIARDRLLRVYLTASDLERTTWREAEVAMAAKRSLTREAIIAADRLKHTRHTSARFALTLPRLALR